MANQNIINFLSDIEVRLQQVSKSLSNMRKVGAGSHKGAVEEVQRLRDALKSMQGAIKADDVRKQLTNVEKALTGSSDRIAQNQVDNTKKVRNAEDKAFKRRMDNLTSVSGRLYEFFKMQMLWYPAKAVTFKLLAVPSNVIRSTAEYTDALAQLSAVAQMLPNELASVDKTMIEISRSTKFSMTEIAAAAKQLAQAGFSGEEIKASLVPITNLATATAASIADTTNLISTIVRAYKVAVTDIHEVSDVLANAVTSSRLTINALNESFSYVASASAQAGLSYKQTVVQLGLLANAGMKSSTAATGLRMALLKMIAPSKQAIKVLKDVGLSVGDISVQEHGLDKVLKTLSKLSTGNLVKIFSARSANAILALTNAGEEARRIMEESLNREGMAAAMKAEQLLDLKQSWKNLGDTAQSIAIDTGRTFEEELAVKIRAFKSLLVDSSGAVTILGSSLKFLINNVGRLVAVLLAIEIPKLLGAGALINIKALTTAIKSYTVNTVEATTADLALAEANVSLEASTIGLAGAFNWVAIGIGTVIASTVLIFNHFRKLAENIEEARTALVKFELALQKTASRFTDVRIRLAKTKQVFSEGDTGFLSKEMVNEYLNVEKENVSKLIEETKEFYKKAGRDFSPLKDLIASVNSATSIKEFEIAVKKLEKALAEHFSKSNFLKNVRELIDKKLKSGNFFTRSSILEEFYGHLNKSDSLKEALGKMSHSEDRETVQILLDRMGVKDIQKATEHFEGETEKSKDTINSIFQKFFKSISEMSRYGKGAHGLTKSEYLGLVTPLKAEIDTLEKFLGGEANSKLIDMKEAFSRLLRHIFIAPDMHAINADLSKFEKEYTTALRKIQLRVNKGLSIPQATDIIIDKFVQAKQKQLQEIDEEINTLTEQRDKNNVNVSVKLNELYKKRADILKKSPAQTLLKLSVKQSEQNEKLIKSGGDLLKIQRDTAKLGLDYEALAKIRAASIQNRIDLINAEIHTLSLKLGLDETNNELIRAQIKIKQEYLEGLKKQQEALPIQKLREEWAERKKTLDLQLEYNKLMKDSVGISQIKIQALQEEIAFYESLADKLKGTNAGLENNNRLEAARQALANLTSKETGNAFDGLKLSIDELNSKYKDLLKPTKMVKDATTNLASSMESAFTDSFKGIIDGTMSVADAFKNMADRIINALMDIAAQQAAQGIMGLIAKGAGMALGAWMGSSVSAPTAVQLDRYNATHTMTQMAHKGGIVGESITGRKLVNPMIFNNAPRLHDGLAADEFPTILQKGEQVIPKNQVGQAPNITLNVINQTSKEVSAETSQPKWDGKSFVINTILTDIRKGGPLRGALGVR